MTYGRPTLTTLPRLGMASPASFGAMGAGGLLPATPAPQQPLHASRSNCSAGPLGRQNLPVRPMIQADSTPDRAIVMSRIGRQSHDHRWNRHPTVAAAPPWRSMSWGQKISRRSVVCACSPWKRPTATAAGDCPDLWNERMVVDGVTMLAVAGVTSQARRL